jgi:hypothetical protein
MKGPDPLSILRPPCCKNFQPDRTLRLKIARYFSVVINKPYSKILKQIPASMPMWGKVRIANGGDSIRSGSASRSTEKERDMSCVRVCPQNFKKRNKLLNLNGLIN